MALGPLKSRALEGVPLAAVHVLTGCDATGAVEGMHALTGCDATGKFLRVGKGTWFQSF